MSLYNNTQCTGGNFTRDFAYRGDKDTKVYTLQCRVYPDEYESLDLNTRMDSAASAGVNVLPFSADNDAFFVGDSNWNLTGGLLLFNRMFANVPKSYEEAIGMYGFTFPKVPGGIFTEESTIDEDEDYNTSTFILELTLNFPDVATASKFQETQKITVTNPDGWSYKLTSGGSTFTRNTFEVMVDSVVSNVVRGSRRWSYFQYGGADPGEKAFQNLTNQGNSAWTVRRIVYPERSGFEGVNSKAKRVARFVRADTIDEIATQGRFVLTETTTGESTSTTSDTTTPYTTESYRNLALANEYLNAEPEVATRWKGNIWEFSIVRVQAI